ncbi:ATP-binding protein [Mycobacterium mantenii]|uniref:ATP-binding protein n=1 Tax=Mycobacterium mantenii TaxID=560555 RepID=UPI0009EF5A26|nr:ATP-binding protein [Mycobacterium mantenii]
MNFTYITNDGLLYDAIFRHYRNAFVTHVRHCLVTEFGSAAESHLRDIFGTEWDEIVQRVRRSESAGSVARTRRDDFDYLDIAYFERLIDHFHEYLVDERWNGQIAVSSKKSLIGWIRELKSVRDPTAHPGSDFVDLRDAIRAVDTARRVLARLGSSESQEELERIEAELLERITRPHEIGSAAPLDDSLPRQETIVDDFVGRANELRQLRAFLGHPKKNRWLLVGDGGKGKTAIAYTFAREIIEASPTGLCAVFWLSAKRRKYQIDRVEDIPNPDFSTLDECVERLLISYGHHEALGFTPEDRKDELLRLLDEVPILLVVDDLDSVDEDNEDAVEFLTLDVPRTSSKVLFTSRRKFAGMGETRTDVSGLPEDEALEFVRKWCECEGFNQEKLTSADQRAIIKACEGSPLFMGDLLRLIASCANRAGKFEPAPVIRDWMGQKGDTVRRYALQREMDMLTDNARRILEAMGIAGRPVTIEEISVLTAFSTRVVLGAIDELRQLYLLNAPALEEETPRYHLNGNLAILVRSELADTPREKKLAAALEALEGRGPELAQATHVRDITRQARLLINGNRLAEAERLLQRAIEDHPESAHFLALLGFAYIDWQPRRNADARHVFDRAAQLRHDDKAMFLAWSRIEYEQGNWQNAINAAEAGLRNRSRKDPMLMQAEARAHLGMARAFRSAFHEGKARESFAAADRLLEEAIKEAKSLGLRTLDINLLYRDWVRLARQQKREGAVCARLKFWQNWRPSDRELRAELAGHLALCKKGGEQFHVAAQAPRVAAMR